MLKRLLFVFELRFYLLLELVQGLVVVTVVGIQLLPFVQLSQLLHLLSHDIDGTEGVDRSRRDQRKLIRFLLAHKPDTRRLVQRQQRVLVVFVLVDRRRFFSKSIYTANVEAHGPRIAGIVVRITVGSTIRKEERQNCCFGEFYHFSKKFIIIQIMNKIYPKLG